MFPVLQLGSLALQMPGLILIAGLWLSLSLSERFLDRYGVKPGDVDTLALGGLAFAALGGRLAYAALNLPAFAASPAGLVSLNLSLWDPAGGAVIGLAFCAWYGRRHRLPFWPLLDGLTPALAAMLVAVGLAHLAAGSAYGEPARLPWSIFLWGEWRHPSQVYEILGAALALSWVLWRLSARRPAPAAGRLFLDFLAATLALWIFLERFRGDSTFILGGIRAGQVGAWLALALCLWLIGYRRGLALLQNTPNPQKSRSHSVDHAYE